jgi:hypothetical protein
MVVSIASGGLKVALTQGHVIVWLYRHVLLHLDLVDCLEDGEAMSDTVDAHLLELCVLQSHQHLSRDDFLWAIVSTTLQLSILAHTLKRVGILLQAKV